MHVNIKLIKCAGSTGDCSLHTHVNGLVFSQ